jgi:hypothetical protein
MIKSYNAYHRPGHFSQPLPLLDSPSFEGVFAGKAKALKSLVVLLPTSRPPPALGCVAEPDLVPKPLQHLLEPRAIVAGF